MAQPADAPAGVIHRARTAPRAADDAPGGTPRCSSAPRWAGQVRATWLLDSGGSLVTRFELSSLTRGRVMHYAIPEHLKADYGVTHSVPTTHRWTPPASGLA